MTVAKPASRPNVPHFSSGPCAKRPGWNPQNLKDATLGRSHRAKVGKAKLKLAIELTREVLEVPADYKIGIVPASDTGAVEMALWSLLGARPVTTIAWESFGEGWVSDIVKELKLKDVTKLHAGYGDIADLSKADPASDIIFTWNGTTSGVRVPNADWISATREVLEVPADYKIGIVPASDTGAVEMALWSLLGPRPVTLLAWESFGDGWVNDVVKELKLKDVTTLKAGYGALPDLSKVDPASDVVFTWNGTTSGVRVPNADWIAEIGRAHV